MPNKQTLEQARKWLRMLYINGITYGLTSAEVEGVGETLMGFDDLQTEAPKQLELSRLGQHGES